MNAQPGVFIDLLQKLRDRFLDRADTNPLSGLGKEDGVPIGLWAEGAQQLIALRFVVANRADGVIADRYDALLPPLSANLDLLRNDVELASAQSLELRQAHSC